MSKLKSQGKSFEISKREVWEAFWQVKANQGAAGVDGQSIADFEADLKNNLKNNLFKVWNPDVIGDLLPAGSACGGDTETAWRRDEDAGHSRLSPTGVAQTVVARHLGVRVEPVFHEDSYGYRRERGALDAVAKCRQRCWEKDWVIDLDVRKFFDSVPWDLMVKAVQANTTHEQRWIVLYVRRWLAAPIVMPDGRTEARDKGTPQGSAVSPVLANLFMHHAFDKWLERELPAVKFERYADDAVVHCAAERQANEVLAALEERMAEVGLQLHPDKTRIVFGAQRFYARHGFTVRSVTLDLDDLPRVAGASG